MKATAWRLARLEVAQRATLPDVWPSYLVGVDVDDLQAQQDALQARGFMGRLTGYIGVSPDDWECDDHESNGA